MKKVILFALLWVVFAKLTAFDFFDKPIGALQKILVSDLHEEWTICLEDGTCWDLMPMEPKKERTWWQWLNGVKKQTSNFDESFISDPLSWKCHQEVQIYEFAQDRFEGFNYILENQSTGKKVLAKRITFGDRLVPQIEFAKVFFSYPGKEVKIASNHSSMKRAMIMDDGTIWLLTKITKRSRTWKKWWNGIENDQPDLPFLVELDQWKEGDLLQFYQLPRENLYSEPIENSYLYLIENKTTSQLAYAQPISLIDFANFYKAYAIQSYNRGYSSGYSDGYSSGQSSCPK